MRKLATPTILAVAAFFWVVASANGALAKTEVYRLVDSPFDYTQCYSLGDDFEGPADYFGVNVCVHYEALNTVTTRIRMNKDGTEDVGWTLTQNGTATITSNPPNLAVDPLYVGPFHVEEVGQDDGNDAGCVGVVTGSGEPVAWLGKCGGNRYTTLDFMRYHWKITGNKVYFYEFRVTDPGQYCFLDDRGVVWDYGGCPPGL